MNTWSTQPEIRQSLIAELPGWVSSIQWAVDAVLADPSDDSSGRELRRLAKSLSGVAASLGMTGLAGAARRIDEIIERISLGSEEMSTLCIELSLVITMLESCVEPTIDSMHSGHWTAQPFVGVISNDVVQGEMLRRSIAAHGYLAVLQVDPGAFLAQEHKRAGPDLLVIDISEANDDGVDGLAVLRASVRLLPKVPVVFISRTNDQGARLTAYRAGAARTFLTPVDHRLLIEGIEALTRKRRFHAYRVLVVGADPFEVDQRQALLTGDGFVTRGLSDPLQVQHMLSEFAIDVLLCDVEMPGCSGLELAALLRDQPRFANVPILFIGAASNPERPACYLDQTDDAFLARPVADHHLLATITMLARRQRESSERYHHMRATIRVCERERIALNAHAIVSIADIAGNIAYANSHFCRISGFSHEELFGSNHRILKSGEHSAAFYRSMWATIAQGHIWEGEVCNRRKDGSLYWVQSTIVPFLGVDSRPYQYMSIRTDITSLKTSMEQLRVLKRAIEASPSSIVIADARAADMPLIYVNPAFEVVTGYPAAEVIGRNCRFLAAEERQQAGLDVLRAAIRVQQPASAIVRNFRKDGQPFWNEVNIAPVADESGAVTHFVAINNDVSERLQVQLALRESEDRFRRSQAHGGIGTWEWNIESDEMVWSERVGPLLGGDPFAKASFDEFTALVFPDDRSQVIDAFKKCFERGDKLDIQHRVSGSGDGLRWVLQRGDVERDEGGQPKRMLGVVQDITLRRQAEISIIEARDHAEAANQAKSEFLSSMNHELRTPMNAVLGFAQLLDTDPELSADQRENVVEILRAGAHLLELINQVLDLSRVEAGRLDLSMETVEVGELVRECIQLIKPLAKKRRLTFKTNLGEPMFATADRMRLRQVLINLLSNAVKYNRPDGAVRTNLSYNESTRTGRIVIADNGIGVPAERLEEIFMPFNRVSADQGVVEGTGIGLSIAKQLTELMGGRLGVESEFGVGSRFWIELPLGAPPAPGALSSNQRQADSVVTVAGNILYIEDDPTSLRLVERILAMRPGIALVSAHTVTLGLELALAAVPDLILLDIELPGLDGHRVLEYLRGNAALASVPVVAISADAMPQQVVIGAGFDQYLTKPFDPASFLDLVDRYLRPKVSQVGTSP